jgi:hypothetical protein
MMVMMNKPAPETATDPPSSAGKYVVVGIFGVALIAATAGLAYKYFASQQPIAMWGADGVRTIQSAPKVLLLNLAATDSPTETTLQYGKQMLQVTGQQDISTAQGLIHHRHFLTEYVSYQNPPTAATERRLWTHALRFQDGAREVTVLFDLQGKRLGNLQTQREVEIIPKIAENWQRFIERQAKINSSTSGKN